jgi:hypothetical protein
VLAPNRMAAIRAAPTPAGSGLEALFIATRYVVLTLHDRRPVQIIYERQDGLQLSNTRACG